MLKDVLEGAHLCTGVVRDKQVITKCFTFELYMSL